MKRQTDAPAAEAPGMSRPLLAAYAVGFLAFAGGLALLVAGNYAAGVGLSLLAVLAVTAVFMAPSIAWRARVDSLRASGESLAAKGGRASLRGGAAPAVDKPSQSASEFANQVLDGLLARIGDDDHLSINRMFLLAPAVVLLILSAALSITSTVQGVGAFIAAGLVLWVYFQDMLRPLVIPHLRQNAISLIAQTPALPVQILGIWFLNAHYNRPGMVWAGFIACAVGSAWMYQALKRWPMDFTESGAPDAPLGWTVPSPFYTLPRWSLITSLLAGAGVAACLAVYVFPADHAGLSVAMAFLAMLLLVGSFPWIPRGLAFSPRFPKELGAMVALAAAALAFAFGAHGQDLIGKTR